MKPKFWLKEVDVDGVHLVGDPANQRPFAIVKSLLGKPTAADPNNEGAQVVKLSEMLKMVGLLAATAELPDGVEDKDIEVKTLLENIGQDDIVKTLGLELKAPKKKDANTEPDLSKLTPDVRAYVEAVRKDATEAKDAVAAIVKANEETELEELKLRRAKLIKRVGEDSVPEDATSVTLDALEAAADRFEKRLEQMGVFQLKGHGDVSDGTALAEVKKAVREILGREPRNVAEEMKIRREVYQDHPGLLTAVTKEERAARIARIA